MPEGKNFKFAVTGERCAPVGAAIKALVDEHGWEAVVSEFCMTVDEFLKRGPANRRNREIMHTWLRVEIEAYMRKKGIQPALDEAFPTRSDRQWWVFVGDKDEKGFHTVDTARRWHWKGQQLMKDPKIAKEWTRKFEVAKWCVDDWKKGGPKAAR